MSPTKVKAVLFDAGFTIVEPTCPIQEIYWDAVREIGVRINREDFQTRLKACSRRMDALRYPSNEHDSSDKEERLGWHRFTKAVARPFPKLRERHEKWYHELIGRFDDPFQWRPMPGVPELLDELKQNGLVLGVISNWHTALHGVLEGLGLRRRLDFALVSAEFGMRKPHPTIFRQGLTLAGSAPAETVHVGDSLVDDAKGAAAVGMISILVSPEGGDEELPEGVIRVERTSDVGRILGDL